EAVDVLGFQPRVGDRPLGGLDPDVARGSARRLGVRRLTDADDRDLSAYVVELRGVSPFPHWSPKLVARYRRPRPHLLAHIRRAGGRTMPMPTDIGVIDLMIGFPEADRRHHYDFLRANLRDHES